MIPRLLKTKALLMAKQFPIVSITGPRQSGKSTLVKKIFPHYKYVTLEDKDMQALALEDPRSFLALYSKGSIIDEAQRAPELFSYLQGVVDETNESGQYILSGSQNFLLMESISQSLAGRVAILNLLPLSQEELLQTTFAPKRTDEWLIKGGYPRLYDAKIAPVDYYSNYVQTYLECDVRTGTGIVKLAEFKRFLGLCASRTGKILNKEELARDCGITVKTAESWLSVLEASFIVLRLQSYYRNFDKRLIKAPKLYFYDTGLACNLLGLEKAAEVAASPMRDELFEAAVVSEVLKAFYAKGRKPKLYYWRDANNNEVDLIVEKGTMPSHLIEVKSSATYSPKFFKKIAQLGDLMGVPLEQRYVVYSGEKRFQTSKGSVIPLTEVHTLFGA